MYLHIVIIYINIILYYIIILYIIYIYYTDRDYNILKIIRTYRDCILASINMYYVMHRRIERVGTVLTAPSARALRWPVMRDSQNKDG